MKHLDRFLDKLKGVREQGTGWKACCPCPDHGKRGDANPSLSLSVGNEHKILLHCFGGCTWDSILEAIGLTSRDLWPKPGDVDAADEAALRARRRGGARPDSADVDSLLRQTIYEALLAKLSLSAQHRLDLRRRGLNDNHIDGNGYRSSTFLSMKKAVTELHEEFGERLLQVPGFQAKAGTITAVEIPSGILVPIRDTGERIVAFQVRSDFARNGNKYLWFSGGTTGSGSPAHVPLGVKPSDLIRITEGPLKADIVWALSGVPTIGIAGVTNWRAALPLLAQLKPKAIRLAFDADLQEKASVANSLRDFYFALKEEQSASRN